MCMLALQHVICEGGQIRSVNLFGRWSEMESHFPVEKYSSNLIPQVGVWGSFDVLQLQIDLMDWVFKWSYKYNVDILFGLV